MIAPTIARPSVTQDRQIRELSESVLDAYPLQPSDRADLSSAIESLLFDIVERTDTLAALLSERLALRSRLHRHGESGACCARGLCLARAAMLARQARLGRDIVRARHRLAHADR